MRLTVILHVNCYPVLSNLYVTMRVIPSIGEGDAITSHQLFDETFPTDAEEVTPALLLSTIRAACTQALWQLPRDELEGAPF